MQEAPKRKRTVVDKVLGKEEPGQMESIAAQILREMQPVGKDGQPVALEPFYRVRMGSTWASFRYPKNSGDIQGIKSGMAEFVFRISQEQSEYLKPDSKLFVMEPFERAYKVRPLDQLDLAYAYILHYWSSPDQPGGKFTEADVLMMVAVNPYRVSQVCEEIEKMLTQNSLVFAYGGVAEKKAS